MRGGVTSPNFKPPQPPSSKGWIYSIFQTRVKSASILPMLEASWNVMAHAQKPDFVFRRNGRVHLNRRGRQFSRLLAVELCASAVVMLDTPCSEVVWRVLATHSIRQFPLSCVTVWHHISTAVYPQTHSSSVDSKLPSQRSSDQRFFWDTTQRIVAIRYRRCGTTYRPHLQA